MGSPWGSATGCPEDGVDAQEHPVRNRVLKRLGLLVDLLPVHVKHLHKERLDEAVLAHNGQRE